MPLSSSFEIDRFHSVVIFVELESPAKHLGSLVGPQGRSGKRIGKQGFCDFSRVAFLAGLLRRSLANFSATCVPFAD